MSSILSAPEILKKYFEMNFTMLFLKVFKVHGYKIVFDLLKQCQNVFQSYDSISNVHTTLIKDEKNELIRRGVAP